MFLSVVDFFQIHLENMNAIVTDQDNFPIRTNGQLNHAIKTLSKCGCFFFKVSFEDAQNLSIVTSEVSSNDEEKYSVLWRFQYFLKYFRQ